jgi:DNA mismatch repair protein MSH6
MWECVEDLQCQLGELNSTELQGVLSTAKRFPDLAAEVHEFQTKFDWDKAQDRASPKIVPLPGAVPEYDAACEQLRAVEKWFDAHLKEVKKTVTSSAKYYHPGTGKERFQIEVPKDTKVPHDWEQKSQTSKIVRYWSQGIRRKIGLLAQALEAKSGLMADMFHRTQAEFDVHSEKWSSAAGCLAHVDCLFSLLHAKDSMGEPMCKPTFVEREESGSAVFDVHEMRHPCLVESGAVEDYIPNDTVLGGSEPSAIVLTGPNMGGKSTLLRQNCVAVIMAQLGAWVPAGRFTMSPVDRIFTRIGANDNIMAGRSTFMVELRETANILAHATSDSLVILDELGRGTSTFDGR